MRPRSTTRKYFTMFAFATKSFSEHSSSLLTFVGYDDDLLLNCVGLQK